jgi:hypothetical protein
MPRSLLLAVAVALCVGAARASDSPPVVAAVDPDGLIAVDVSGDTVTIYGVRFEYPLQVEFGEGNPSSMVSRLSSGKIRARIPAAGSGAVDVIVTSGAAGRKAILEKGFVFLPTPPPVVASTVPVAGLPPEYLQGAALQVQIYGEGFRPPCAVEFGESTPGLLSWVDSTRLPTVWYVGDVAAFGTVDVKVTNVDGQEGVLKDGFTFLPYPPPVVTGVDPVANPAGSLQMIYIYGSNFVPGCTIKFGNLASPMQTWVGSEWIGGRVPVALPPGTVDVTVISPDGQSGTLKDGFTILPAPAPAVTSTSPVAQEADYPGPIEIYGAGFVSGGTVQFGEGNFPRMTSWIGSTKISAYLQSSFSAGTVDIIVTNPDGKSGTLKDGFTVLPSPPPTVLRVEPSAALPGDRVMIYGENFLWPRMVEFGQGNQAQVMGASTTFIDVKVPQGTGTVDVIVTAAGQTGVLADGFTYGTVAPPPAPMPAPTVRDVIPEKGGAALGVNVSGTGFHHEATVEFGLGNNSEYVSFRTDKLLFVVVPEGFGTVDVIVTNPDEQQGVLPDAFTYEPIPAPTVRDVVPDVGVPVLGVIVNGSNFHHEATVEFGIGNFAGFVSHQGPDQLYVVVPEGFGTVDVIVTNPDEQQAVRPGAFTYEPVPAPTVEEVVPDIGAPVLGVYVNGSNFHHAATVQFGTGNFADFVRYQGPDQLYVVVPDGMGTVDVIVANPDTQQAVLPNAFEYKPVPPPEVIEVDSPTDSPVLGVYVNGTGFRYGAEVEFGAGNGAEYVVYLSPEDLYVVVPEGTGVVDIIVRNPDTQEDVLENGFTYIPQPISTPTVAEITPGTGKPILGIYISGTGFVYTPTVQFGPGNLADHVCYRTEEQLFVVVPDPPTGSARTVDIIITNLDGGSVMVEDGFTYDRRQ